MTFRPIDVQVIQKTPKRVTLMLVSNTGRIHVSADEFNTRVKNGMYNIINPGRI